MSKFDLIVRGGIVVTQDDVKVTDIAIADGKIVELGLNSSSAAIEEIDATGLHIFPGIIDAHVHFNEPGRADWEGLETGSRAFAAGGGTLFFDMPLNAHPPTINGGAFDSKLAAAKERSITDFAFWGGLVPGNADRLEELADRGVIGFKAFMSDSGIDDFACVDDATLREGMKRAATLNLPVAVHAESEILTKRLSREKMASGKTSVRDYLDSRPVEAELEAIRRATDMAGETDCALHVVHVSSAEGIALISEAKRKGVDVSAETCPHYLTLTDRDMEEIGALAKCAPPLRSLSEQGKLWECLRRGEIDTIGSDHSPSPPEMKKESNFFKVWGGISGVQHTLPLLLSGSSRLREAQKSDVELPLIGRFLSSNVARCFRLPTAKGQIAVGCDADLAIVDLKTAFEVRTADLFYRHKQTPYAGRRLRGKLLRTLLRGKTIFQNGKIVAKQAGTLVKPLR